MDEQTGLWKWLVGGLGLTQARSGYLEGNSGTAWDQFAVSRLPVKREAHRAGHREPLRPAWPESSSDNGQPAVEQPVEASLHRTIRM